VHPTANAPSAKNHQSSFQHRRWCQELRADQIATGDQVAELSLVGSGQYPNTTQRILDAQNGENQEPN